LRGWAGRLFLIALALNVTLNGLRMARSHLLEWPGPNPSPVTLVVPQGSTAEVARVLKEAGLVRHPLLFRLALWLEPDGPLHAGEFAFPAHASLETVLGILRHGKPVEHHVTIPEGLTVAEVAALLERAPALVGPASPLPSEGTLLPATYAYLWGTPRQALLARAAAAQQKALEEAWKNRAPGLPLASPREAVILASIVERETAKPEERPLIAAVYLNRLRQGMRLDADPTVAYALSEGQGRLGRPLTRSDLAAPSPFNTYRNSGLPPAPIGNPGLAAILAVLHPAPSDALYFVADGKGGHVFARTLEEHDRNVARYRAQKRSAAGAAEGDGREEGR
jgi:UPF0755 protein